MVGMKTMLAKWANVSDLDIFGMRAPRLKPGDNRQFDVSQRCMRLSVQETEGREFFKRHLHKYTESLLTEKCMLSSALTGRVH